MIAVVGVLTALVAATIAVGQNDIKKVLAYSTISQLGYMFLAIGSGAYVAAIFHMVTHAFFKALMFLGSGSVIHGLRRRAGHAAHGRAPQAPADHRHHLPGGLAGHRRRAALLRLLVEGRDPALRLREEPGPLGPRAGHGPAHRLLHEPPGVPDLLRHAPLGPPARRAVPELAAEREEAGVVRGRPPAPRHRAPGRDPPPRVAVDDDRCPSWCWPCWPSSAAPSSCPFTSSTKRLEHWLLPVVEVGEHHLDLAAPRPSGSWPASPWSAGLVGIGIAAALYLRRRYEDQPASPLVLLQGWYYDSTIAAFMGGPGRKAFDAVAWFDRTIIDGAVNGVATLVRGGGGGLRRTQTGFVRAYAGFLTAGAIVVVFVMVLRGAVL